MVHSLFYVKSGRAKLNSRAHFRWLIEIGTRFEALCCDVDFVGRPANVIGSDLLRAWRVDVAQTYLDNRFKVNSAMRNEDEPSISVPVFRV